jgi:DNA polymerase I-like protein with 3'-5' exonuclease and polymerase domains
MLGAKGSISATKLKKVLYTQKGYPEMYKGRGPGKKVTTDVDALLKLKKKFPHDPFLSDVLLHRRLESLAETLEIETDPDGRVRCGYNLVGTETGRLTCYTSPTGSGANLQTITKKLRKLYLADDDHWMFQCDLSGADGWTVAAHCLHHGDSTMWDDYIFGLKPARIVALMYEHGHEITKCSRQELSDRCKAVDDDGWLYFACKRIQHATNYGVQEATVSNQIMVDSYKVTGSAVYVDAKTCAALQRLYFIRYAGLYQWHQWAKREVFEGRNLTSASGHTRTFFGRRKSFDPKARQVSADHETWKEFLAHEPQANTTYVTNLALHRMWTDPENRVQREGRTRLRVEPLHQVHDALIGQFAKSDRDWSIENIRRWFNNPIQIAGTTVIIPQEGKYGRSWGELTEGTI